MIYVTLEVTKKGGDVIMLDANKLRGLIVEKGYTQKDMADLLGITPKTFYTKMTNGGFGIDEAKILIDKLNIEKPCEIFFASNVTS